MAKGVVITHSEMGIFVGAAIMAFWSKLDAAGQDRVATFESKEQALEFMGEWGHDQHTDGYAFVEVETEAYSYATIDELKAAGLEEELGDLMSSLVTVPDIGHA